MHLSGWTGGEDSKQKAVVGIGQARRRRPQASSRPPGVYRQPGTMEQMRINPLPGVATSRHAADPIDAVPVGLEFEVDNLSAQNQNLFDRMRYRCGATRSTRVVACPPAKVPVRPAQPHSAGRTLPQPAATARVLARPGNTVSAGRSSSPSKQPAARLRRC